MSFGQFLVSPEAWPFTLALALFAFIAIAEIVLAIIGIGADFGLHVDVPDIADPGSLVDAAHALDASHAMDAADAAHSFDACPSHFSWALDWLGIGRVPLLVSLGAFLLGFGLIGLAAQDIQIETIGHALPWPLVALGAALVTTPGVSLFNRLLGRIWPKDVETSSVSQDSLVGHQGFVVLGPISSASPGQIKVRDPQGTTHHFLAYADTEGDSIASDEPVLLVSRRGASFLVIRHPNPMPASEH